jgi:putative DNA primase/helicase
VPFAYDPAAPKPSRFLEFLDELWPQETQAVDALQEWFGYVISGRVNLQKMLLMIGPTRGGKGVLARILTALIGKRNVCGPTLSSFAGEFGLAPLLGKSLAIISDVRFSGKGANVVVERLLSISGEDTLTINRKYHEQIDTRMPTRMHLMSNEMPRLTDDSGAIIGRFIVLILTRSWLGKEDHELEGRVCEQMPGIFNWALEGLARLNRNEGRFTRVPEAEEAIIAMRDLASPVAAFVRERCILKPTWRLSPTSFMQSTKYGAKRTNTSAPANTCLVAICAPPVRRSIRCGRGRAASAVSSIAVSAGAKTKTRTMSRHCYDCRGYPMRKVTAVIANSTPLSRTRARGAWKMRVF